MPAPVYFVKTMNQVVKRIEGFPYHVKAFEAQFYGDSRGKTIINSWTHDQVFRISEHSTQLGGSRDDIERNGRLISHSAHFVVAIFLNGDGDSHDFNYEKMIRYCG